MEATSFGTANVSNLEVEDSAVWTENVMFGEVVHNCLTNEIDIFNMGLTVNGIHTSSWGPRVPPRVKSSISISLIQTKSVVFSGSRLPCVQIPSLALSRPIPIPPFPFSESVITSKVVLSPFVSLWRHVYVWSTPRDIYVWTSL